MNSQLSLKNSSRSPRKTARSDTDALMDSVMQHHAAILKLHVCALCYHPSTNLRLQCHHKVCLDCTQTKLTPIIPKKLKGKLFCPICGCFVGQRAETSEISTQTRPQNRKPSYSSDSGFEDHEISSMASMVTSTPIGGHNNNKERVNKRLFEGSLIEEQIYSPVHSSSEEDCNSMNEEDDYVVLADPVTDNLLPSKLQYLDIDEAVKDKDQMITNTSSSTNYSISGYVSAQEEDMVASMTTKTGLQYRKANIIDPNNNDKDYKPKPMRNSPHKPKCQEHKHCSAKYYCQSCEKPICLGCKVGEHKQHHVIPIKVVAWSQDQAKNEEPKPEILEESTKSAILEDSLFPEAEEDHVSELQAWSEELQNYITALQQKQDFAMRRLTARRNYLHHFVERWYSKMSVQIDTTFAKEVKDINQTLEQVKASIKQHENAAEALDTEEIVLDHVNPRNFAGPLTEDFAVVMTTGMGLTYNMLGTFSASYFKSNTTEPLPPTPTSNFEDSFSMDLDSLFNKTPSSSTDSQCLSCSVDLPTLRFLPKPQIHVISQGQEIRTFETRSANAESNAYMATGLSIMEDGRILITDLGQDSVMVFSPTGRFLLEVATLPDDQPTKAIELNDDNILVATKSGLKLYRPDGEFRGKVSKLESPQAIAAAPNGNIIISDHRNDSSLIATFRPDCETRVHVFTSTSHKDPEYQFVNPWFIATNDANDAFISDRADHTIKKYSRRGGFRWTAGGQGAGPGQLFRPAGLVVDAFGHVLVADSGNDRVQVFSPRGDWLGIVVDSEQHELEAPMDLAINAAGHLLVLQADGKVRSFQYLL